ncbi:MAG: hypothetical protein C0483_07525 [Pirellula sp.]|nr:hypothetical protein [Pirellula sp.]
MLTVRETATLLAALQHWQEEMLPHGRDIMRPYFRTVGCDRITPLNRAEVAHLSLRLKSHFQSLVA